MENYQIGFDSYFDSFILYAYMGDDFICDVDSCSIGDADRLRYWLSEFNVSYICALAESVLIFDSFGHELSDLIDKK